MQTQLLDHEQRGEVPSKHRNLVQQIVEYADQRHSRTSAFAITGTTTTSGEGMKFRCSTMMLLALFFVALSIPNIAFAEETGKFKVGALYNYEDHRNNETGESTYANFSGFLLGYEKRYDSFWWSIDGKYRFGRLGNEKGYANLADIYGQAVVGMTYDVSGFMLKPFIGLGASWEDQDMHKAMDVYFTEYVLPIGMRVERNTSMGLFGIDLQYGYVLRREMYGTDFDGYWGSRNFDGSYNVEVGLYHEHATLPIGVRASFKYERWQTSKYWYQLEREHLGVETYVKF